MQRLISDIIQCLDLDILLSNKPWPFHVALSVNGKLYWYWPRSDFSIFLKNFPDLIIEVTSDKGLADKHRMLLQAACLVRLGNTLFQTLTPDFIVKAIYIGPAYQAKEYTLYATSTDDERKEMVMLPFRLLPNEKTLTIIIDGCELYHKKFRLK